MNGFWANMTYSELEIATMALEGDVEHPMVSDRAWRIAIDRCFNSVNERINRIIEGTLAHPTGLGSFEGMS